MSKVVLLKTSPETVIEDYSRLLSISDFKNAVPKDEDLILKLNLSWTKFFPACSSPPWQLDGVLNYLVNNGYKKIFPVENKTVVTDVMRGAENNKWNAVLRKYNMNLKPLNDAEWIEYKLKSELMVLNKIIRNYKIPKMLIGKNILQLPTIKIHGHSITTGAMKNAFGGLIRERRHHCHKHIHEVLVDLLAIQKEIHPGMFAVMDGTVCGDGAGPRTMVPREKNFILAGDDAVAVDATASKMMGFEPLHIPYLKIAHNKGLGNADMGQIEVIGIDRNEFNEINFRFNVKKSPVILFDKLLRSSLIEPLLFRTMLFNICIFGSWIYHDLLWYPTIGRKRIKEFMKTDWGKLFKEY
ncbi:DUF362 domain-containing protein [archaeon]|nr:DUF362 domain-containing protein [archaeon]